jgi:hypothetical protein
MIYKEGASVLPVEEEVVESHTNEDVQTPRETVISPEISEVMSETISEVTTIAMLGQKAKEFSKVAKTNLVKAGHFSIGKLKILKGKVEEMRNKRNGVSMDAESESLDAEEHDIPRAAIPQRVVKPMQTSDSRLYDEDESEMPTIAPVPQTTEEGSDEYSEYSESSNEDPQYDSEGNIVAQYKPFADEADTEVSDPSSVMGTSDSDNGDEVYEDVYEEEQVDGEQMEEVQEPQYVGKHKAPEYNVASGSRLDSIKGKFANVDKEKISGILGSIFEILKKLAAILFELTLRLIDLFKREILGVGENRRDRLARAKRRRRNRIILVVVVIVLFLVISNSIRSAQEARTQQEQLDTARSKVSEFANAHTVLDAKISNAKASGDVAVQNLLADFDRLNAEINVQKRDGLLAEDFTSIQQDIQFSKDELLNITAVTTPQVLVDVGRSYPDANLADIEYSNGGIFISDQGRNVVYRVGTASLNGVAQSFVTGLTQPYTLVRNVDGNIVFYDNDSTSAMGVIDYESGDVTRFPGLTPSSIGRVTESSLYSGNDSLYEVRNGTTQIFKRDKNGSGYVNGGSTQSGDFNSNWRVDSDFANAVDISTPYEIYMLIKGQGIKRYFAREANTLTSNLFSNISAADLTAIQNGSSLDAVDTFVAVGDPAGKRIFLFRIDDTAEKGLTLVKQYVYRGSENVFSDIDEIVIVPGEGSIYVLDNLKVIKLSLQ